MQKICKNKHFTRNFDCQILLFKKRLHRRQYPSTLVIKYCSQVTFNHRTHYYLRTAQSKETTIRKPIFKCLPPPSYIQLKTSFYTITTWFKTSTRPPFIALGHSTLRKELVRTSFETLPDQLFDILVTLPSTSHPQRQHQNIRNTTQDPQGDAWHKNLSKPKMHYMLTS